MAKIFISYRRDDSAAHAGRLYDRLEGHFGQGQVFMDVDAIEPGLDFAQVVQQAVNDCDGLIAVIGREWLRAPGAAGVRRLEDPVDLVRLEIAAALERGIRVIPVLVQGAQMPQATDLPDDLKGLASRNALEISDTRFRSDVDRLIEALEAPTQERPELSVFVGRQRELGELRAALEESLTGRGRLAMLVGEPGIGKTRTAQELASYAQDRGAQVYWGRCYDESGAPPYWPWVQAIREYVQQAAADRLQAEMGPGAADIAGIVPDIDAKLPGLPSPPALEPEQARFRLFDSITRFCKTAARSQPLVLILDDLHWADEPSLLLLRFMAQQLQDSCILVVGCYRDVELSRQHPLSNTLAQLSREQGFQRHLLRGLSREETGQLVEAASGIQPGPPVVDTVYAHTDGNPYFMTELVRLLVSQGGLEEAGAAGSQGLRIPEGVREVIGQRLNRLSEQCNRVLTTSSVIGREFRLDQLERLLEELSEDQLLEALEEALEARLIEELAQTPGHYQFAHRLAQETLTQELSLTRRVRLHARIATVLEELYGTNADAHAAELAYHFAQAETVTGTDKLVQYSLLAGEQALAAYGYEEALVLFQRALEAKQGQPTSAGPGTPVDGDTAALLFGLARAQIATLLRRMYHEPFRNLRLSFDYYVEAGDVDAALAVAEYRAPRAPDIDLGRNRLLSDALALVPPDSLHAGLLLAECGSALYFETNDYDGAQEAFGRALAIAEKERDQALEMRVLTNSTQVDLWTLNWEEAPLKGQRAIELARSLGDLTFQVTASYTTARVLAAMGQRQQAQRLAEAILAPAENLRSFTPLADALWINGTLCRSVGNWQDARRFLESDTADMSKRTTTNCDLAVLNHQVGDLVQGSANIGRVLENPAAGVA